MIIIRGYKFLTGRLTALSIEAAEAVRSNFTTHVIVYELNEDELMDYIKSVCKNRVNTDKIVVHKIEKIDEQHISDIINEYYKSSVDRFFIHAKNMPSKKFISKHSISGCEIYWYYQEKNV